MPLSAGEHFSHYQIHSKLGAGGMGEVYLASDTRLGRNVALKILPSGTAQNEEAQKRLLREARTAASLDHPNICSVYEVGEENNQSYIAMQYVEGGTLDVRLKGRELSWTDALKISSQIADGLAAAHARNIVHRDIKPSNIMLSARGQAKILDFGLAKLTSGVFESPAGIETSLLTEPGVLLGTLPYMSPEQVSGETVDVRTDIFSLGVLIHEMLTGRHTFMRRSAAETIAAILSEEPSNISDSLGAPQEFKRIVRKCLAKDRERRYQTARELLVDLENLQHDLSTQPISDSSVMTTEAGLTGSSDSIDRAGSSPPELTKGWRLRLSIFLILLSIAALSAIYGWKQRTAFGTPQTTIKSIAVLPLANLSADPAQDYFADGMTDALITQLAKIRTLRVISRSSTMQYKATKKTNAEVARELNVDAVVEGSILRSGDKVRISAQLYRAGTDQNLWSESYEREMQDVLSVQSDIARGIVTGIKGSLTDQEEASLSIARAVKPEAQEALFRGRYYFYQAINTATTVQEQLALHQKSFEQFQNAINLEPGYAEAYAEKATSYHWLASSGVSNASDYYLKSLEAAQTAIRLDEKNALAHNALAYSTWNYRWDAVRAEKEYKRATQLDPNRGHHGYAYLLSQLGRYEEALREVEIAELTDPLNFPRKLNIVSFHIAARQYDRALAQCRYALSLNPTRTGIQWYLATALSYKGQFDEALDTMKKYVGTSKEPAEESAVVMAWVYAMAGKRKEAIETLENYKRRPIEERNPYQIARVSAVLGDRDQAMFWLEQSVLLREDSLRGLKVSPDFDDLRSDPRFQNLLRRIGFTS